MEYKSLLRFFDFCVIDYSDVNDLQVSRIKKQIAAEFSLSATGIVNVDGVDFSKQDLLSELDSADFKERFQLHKLLWEHKSLLKFVEKGIVEEGFLEDFLAVKDNDAFVHFISPYFAPHYSKEMKRRLSEHQFDAAADWVPFCELVLLSDGEIAFQSTHAFLNNGLRLFRNVNKTTLLKRKPEIEPWTGNWAVFLNRLPDEFFGIKDDLTNALINFLVEIQNADFKLTYQISQQMTQLDFMDEADKELVFGNHEIYAQKVNPSAAQQTGKKKSYKIWWILFFVVSIVRLIDRCDSKTHDLPVPTIVESPITDIQGKDWFKITRAIIKKISPKREGQETIPIADTTVYITAVQERELALQSFVIENKSAQGVYCSMLKGEDVKQYYIDAYERLEISANDSCSFDMIISTDFKTELNDFNNIEKFVFISNLKTVKPYFSLPIFRPTLLPPIVPDPRLMLISLSLSERAVCL